MCDDGHLQRRTPSGTVRLPAAPVPAVCAARWCLPQVQKWLKSRIKLEYCSGVIWWFYYISGTSSYVLLSLSVSGSNSHFDYLSFRSSSLIFTLHSFPSTCPRLFGMMGVIRANSSDRHTLGLHPHVIWPDFVNPFVLLLLYNTLVALLHKWVHITEEVCMCVRVCQLICHIDLHCYECCSFHYYYFYHCQYFYTLDMQGLLPIFRQYLTYMTGF